MHNILNKPTLASQRRNAAILYHNIFQVVQSDIDLRLTIKRLMFITLSESHDYQNSNPLKELAMENKIS